jgi:hypothetical protein
VDPVGLVLACNASFDRMSGLIPGATGHGLAELLGAEWAPPDTRGHRPRLTLRLGSTSPHLVSFLVYGCPAGHVLVGERVLFTETHVVERLAALHEDLVNATRELQKKNAALEEAKAHIRTLSGILPICSYCKKIRNDQGYWEQVEAYVSQRTDADFSHSVCQECMPKVYPHAEYPFLYE